MLNLSQATKRYMLPFIWLNIAVVLIGLAITPANTVSQSPPYELLTVAWSPNGDMIVGGGSDGLLRIWDTNGTILQDFQGIQWAVISVAWSPDGTRIVSGGGDQIIRIWDVDGPLLTSIDAHDAIITSVTWNPDGSLLASATHSGLDEFSLRIWDGNTYEPLIAESSGRINSIAWNPNPARSELAFAKENYFAAIETVAAIELQFSGLAYENTVAMVSVAWNSDGSRLATGDRSGRIDIWDAADFSNVSTFTGHTDVVDALVWSPDDTQLASSSSDGTIRIWDVVSGQTINVFQNPMQIRTNSIDWNNTGLIFGKADATVEIIEFPIANAGLDQNIIDVDNSGSELVTLDGSLSTDSDGTIVSYAWSENGIVIATGVNPQVSLSVGVHNIILTVTDDDGATGGDIVVITVESPSVVCDTTVPINDTVALSTAISNANTLGTSQTLCIDGTYDLTTIDNSDYDGANGLPVITGDITLYSANGATITRSSTENFRIAKVDVGGRLVLDGITVSNGNPGAENGGGIRNRGTLEVINSTFITGNTSAASGGGIRNNDNATLIITNSTISNNISTGNGGGVYSNSNSFTTITNSLFSNNTANLSTGLGGGSLRQQSQFEHHRRQFR
ncbi:MAG: hypothetical protein Q9P01_00875 [Anaerolineae bacterium]|nr:hypothetical protein [Anaerolineae bacterium]